MKNPLNDNSSSTPKATKNLRKASRRKRLVALIILTAMASAVALSATSSAKSLGEIFFGNSPKSAARTTTKTNNATGVGYVLKAVTSAFVTDEETPAEEQEIKVATVATDRTDYAPGDTVTITGSGWKAATVDADGNATPGETVKLTLHKEREGEEHEDINMSAVADENGNILDATYAPTENDKGMWYRLEAEGQESGLTSVTTFTDAITSTANVSISANTTLTACEGTQVVFTAGPTLGSNSGFNAATSGQADTVTYQWYKGSTAIGASGTRTITANNTINSAIQLTLSAAAVSDSGSYTLQVSNSRGQANTVTSNILALATTAKAKITGQPDASQSVAQGSTVTFSVDATGAKADGSDLTYQWKKDGTSISNSAAKGISGATTSTLTLSNVTNRGNTNNDSGTYTVVVTSNFSGSSCGANSVTSNGAVLNVASQATSSLNTSAASGNYGGATSLSATLTSNNSGISNAAVSFTLNGTSIGSATTNASGVATLSTNLGTTAVGSYQSGVSASFAGDTSYSGSSNTASLTVSQADTVTSAQGGTFPYDGQGHGASATVMGNGANITGNVNALTLTYAPQGSANDSTALPVNAGTYDVYVAHNGNANFKSHAKAVLATITIGKADPTVTVTGGTYTYNGSARAASGSAKGVNNTDLGAVSLSYSQNGTALTGAPTNAGTYSVTASFPGNGNYNGKSSAPGQIVIGQADATVTVSGGGTFTYDGNAHAATASAKGVNNEDLGATSVSYAQGNSAVQGAPVNAGTYSVNASFNGNGNYKSANGAGQIVINQADATLTANGGTFTYTGDPQGGSANGKGVKNEDLAVSVSYTEGANALQGAPVNAGGYTLTASFPGNGNYKGSSKTAAITINPATATLTATGGTFTYNGDAQGGNGSAKGVKNEDLAVSIGYAEGTSAMNGAPVSAGTYNATVSLNSNRNYNAASKSATITINQADPTMNVAGGNYTYNGSAQGGSGGAAGVKGEDLVASISYSEGSNALQGAPVQAGTYNVTASVGSSRNYKAASKSAVITIGQADATVDVTGGEFNYTGDAQVGSGNAKGVNGENLGASVSYAEGSNALQGAPVQAGTYSVTSSFGGNRNYKAASKSGAIVIKPVDPQIDGAADSSVYDGNVKGGNGNAKGVKGEPLNVNVSYSENGTALQGAPKDAGAYSMTVSYGGSRNYNAVNKTVNFNIGQADSSIDMSDVAAGFDGQRHGTSAAVRGVGNESPGSATPSYVDVTPNQDTTGKAVDAPVNAGTYQATASFGGNRNYKASSKAATITIGQADSSIDDMTDPNADFDGAGHTVSAGVSGAGGLSAAASISYFDETTKQSVSSPVDAGHYTVTASFGGTRNHKASSKGGGVTIKPIDASITVDADPNADYDSNSHTIGGKATGVNGAQLGAATITYVDDTTGLATTNPTDAGHYTATAKFTGNRNYNAGNKAGGVTIKQVDSTIAITGGPFTYNGNGQSAAASVKGVKGEDLSGAANITYVQDGTNDAPSAGAPVNAATYNVSATHGGNRNYRATTKLGKITIGAANANFDATLTDVEYNGLAQGTSLNVTGAKGEGLDVTEVTYALGTSSSSNTPVNVGDYTVSGKITGQICHVAPYDRCYPNYNPGFFKRTHRIHKAHIVVAVTGGPVQYSDQTLVKVKVTGAGAVQNDVNNGGNFSYTLTNSSNQTVSITPTSVTPTSNGGYDVVFTMLYAPGDYTLTANFTPSSPNLLSATGSGNVKVTQEDAAVFYTGLLYVTTSSTSSNSASVALTTTVKDITAVPSLTDVYGNPTGPNPLYDQYPGDISNAKVTFYNGTTALCSANVGLVSTSDKKVGTATCNATLSTGNAVSNTYQIHTVVSGYYKRDNSADDANVTISQPTPGLVTGGGYLVAQNTSGANPADVGTKVNYGFNIKNSTNTGAPQGNINVIFRKMVTDSNGVATLHVYQIKGNAMTSLTSSPYKSSTTPGTATFNGKANIQDITDPMNIVSLGGNQTLQVTMTDNGDPGSADKIGITLFNSLGGVYFSSNWDGTKTVQQTIGGGNLQVR